MTSSAANTVGAVRSRNASTTRKRDHASQAQNSTVLRPSMTGPSPKSYRNHIPGSVTPRAMGTDLAEVQRDLRLGHRPPSRSL